MHRAAGTVTLGLRQVQRFHHHALSGKSGIAVQQHRQDCLAGMISTAVLARAHRALYHRVDDLQMRRIERQRYAH